MQAKRDEHLEKRTAGDEKVATPEGQQGGRQKRFYINTEVLRLVYETLKQHSVGGRCRLSVRDVAELCGLSHPGAQRALQRLRAEGLIHTEPGRYQNEPDTIYVNPYGYADKLLRFRSSLENIIDELRELLAFLPSAARMPQENQEKAAALENLRQAIVSYNELPGGFINLIVSKEKLGSGVLETLLPSSAQKDEL